MQQHTLMIHDNLPSLILHLPTGKRFSAKSRPSTALLACGPIWKHRPQIHTLHYTNTLLAKTLPNSSESWFLVRRQLSRLNIRQWVGFIAPAPAKWAWRLPPNCENGILIFRPHIGYYPAPPSKSVLAAQTSNEKRIQAAGVWGKRAVGEGVKAMKWSIAWGG